MPDAPEVKITAVDASVEADRDWPFGEGELKCDLCGGTIGYHLTVDRETDMDRDDFTLYWEIETPPTYVDGDPDYVRLCEDDWSWAVEIAPAVIAYAAKS